MYVLLEQTHSDWNSSGWVRGGSPSQIYEKNRKNRSNCRLRGFHPDARGVCIDGNNSIAAHGRDLVFVNACLNTGGPDYRFVGLNLV